MRARSRPPNSSPLAGLSAPKAGHAALGLAFVLAACVSPAPPVPMPTVAEPKVIPLAADEPARRVILEPIEVTIDAKQPVGVARYSTECGFSTPLRAMDLARNMAKVPPSLWRAAAGELAAAHYPVLGAAATAFKDLATDPERIIVGAKLVDLRLDTCDRRDKLPMEEWVSGRAWLRSEWTVRAPDDARPSFSMITEGVSEPRLYPNLAELLATGFAQATRGLIADPRFAAVVRKAERTNKLARGEAP